MDLFFPLPAWAKEKLTETECQKEWRKCAFCRAHATAVPFKACARCANSPQPVFYCGRKCQKNDWRSHKTDCNHSLIYNPSEYDDYKAMKQLRRWIAIHSYILTFCILELFCFNPDLDIKRHFVQFELDRKNMQIVTISVRNMADHSDYFGSPAVQASLIDEDAMYEVTIQGSPLEFMGRKGAAMRNSPLEQLRSGSGRSRDSIGEYEDWLYIASYLTMEWQTSENVARRKQALLMHSTNVIRLAHRNALGRFKSPANLSAPFSIHTDAKKTERWCTELMSYDLWTSFIHSGVLPEILEGMR